jgi:hypothetical protein
MVAGHVVTRETEKSPASAGLFYRQNTFALLPVALAAAVAV